MHWIFVTILIAIAILLSSFVIENALIGLVFAIVLIPIALVLLGVVTKQVLFFLSIFLVISAVALLKNREKIDEWVRKNKGIAKAIYIVTVVILLFPLLALPERLREYHIETDDFYVYVIMEDKTEKVPVWALERYGKSYSENFCLQFDKEENEFIVKYLKTPKHNLPEKITSVHEIGWVPFFTTVHGFKTFFPGEPDISRDGIVTIYEYVSEQEAVYSLEVIELNNEDISIESIYSVLFKQTVADIFGIEEKKYILLLDSPGELSGYPSYDFLVQENIDDEEDRSARIQGKMIYANGNLYYLKTTYVDENKHYHDTFSSFFEIAE